MEKDIKLAKWLVLNRYLSKEDAEQALKKIKGSDGSKGILQFLYQQKVLDKKTIIEIQGRIKKTKSNKKEVISKTKKELSHESPVSNKEGENKKEVQDQKAEPKSSKVSGTYGSSLSCPECQSAVPKDAKVCNVCSAEISKASALKCSVCDHLEFSNKFCGNCGCNMESGEPGKSTRLCRECRHVLLPGDVVCMQCGVTQIKNVPKSSIEKWVGVAFAFTIYLSFGATLWSMKKEIAPVSNNRVVEQEIEENFSFYKDIEPQYLDDFKFQEFQEEQEKILEKVLPYIEDKDWGEVLHILEDKIESFDNLLLGIWGYGKYFSDKKEEVVALGKGYSDSKYLRKVVARVHFDKAIELFDSEQNLEAYHTIKNAVELDTGHTRYQSWAGIMAFGEGKLQEANIAFRHALRLDPQLPLPHLFLFLIHKKKNTHDAKKHLEKFKAAELSIHYKNLLKKYD